jgi:signal transduction histidine kinase
VFPSQAWLEDEAEPLTGPIGARAVIFSAPPLLEPIADSNGSTSRDVVDDPLVVQAARGTGIVSGEVTRLGAPYAEAAVSFGAGQPVLFLSTPLNSQIESARAVKRRVLFAGILATVFAIVLGYALATLFARRIRRLEAAAERIAGGRFDEVVYDSAPDELGQLARAFERMRQRLALLERAQNEFIANASHELRTPLFSIAGFLELLAGDDEIEPETRAEFISAITGQVSRLTRLASVLLDLSRMDAGRLAVANEPVDLNLVAETLASDFGPRASTVAHTLRYVGGDRVSARADVERVFQIGRILVENAILHTAPGTTITIEVAVAGLAAQLVVTDDGAGIAAEVQSAVFDRFYRLGGAVASGSGLGLAIAHELAVLMDGSISLESSPGCTRFTLVLPLESRDRSPAGRA